MAIDSKTILQLFDQLPETKKQSAYDYIRFLSGIQEQMDWDELSRLEGENIPLSPEEQRQLNSNSGFMKWEDALDELGISTDSKS